MRYGVDAKGRLISEDMQIKKQNISRIRMLLPLRCLAGSLMRLVVQKTDDLRYRFWTKLFSEEQSEKSRPFPPSPKGQKDRISNEAMSYNSLFTAMYSDENGRILSRLEATNLISYFS